MAETPFKHQTHNTGEPSGERFEIWVRGVCVARSDHEAYLNVYVDGQLVYSLEAEIDYEDDPEKLSFGGRPMPVGFHVQAKSADLDGKNMKQVGRRKWAIKKEVEEKA